MKKSTLHLITLVCLTWTTAHSEPFDQSDYLLSRGGKAELVSMDMEFPYNMQTSTQEKHIVHLSITKYYPAGQLGTLDSMAAMGSFQWTTGLRQYQYGSHSLCLEDVDNDQVCEILMAYSDSGTGGANIRIAAFKPDPASMSVVGSAAMKDSNTQTFNSPPQYVQNPLHKMELADFDGDGRKDIVLAYWARRGSVNPAFIHAKVLSISDSLEFSPMAEQDGPVPLSVATPAEQEGTSVIYTTSAVDIDGDGRANLVVLSNKIVSDSVWGILATVYSLDPAGDSLAIDAQRLIYQASRRTDSLWVLRAYAGHYFDTLKGAVIVSVTTSLHDDSLIAMTMNNDIIAFAATGIPYPIEFPPSLAVPLDLNGDRLLDVRFEATEVMPMVIARLNPDLSMTAVGQIDERVYGYIAGAANIIPDAIDSTATVEVFSYYHYFNSSDDYGSRCRLLRLACNAAGAIIGVDSLSDMRLRFVAWNVQFGDLDGEVRLGTPRQFEVTDIVQPMVILNAPPIHFDIFDANPFDVSLAYNNNDCQFAANYTKASQFTTEVQTTFNKDWGVSASLSTDHSFWVASVKSHFTAKYGEKFSREAGSSRTVTVQVSSDAIEDDRIYATTLTYTVWEYPVYINGRKTGQIVVVDPAITENRWFPSKSWSGYSYQPNHEVGNILSYRQYADFAQNPLLDESIKGNAASSFTLDANSSHDWSLGFTDFASSSATTEKEWGLEMGASVEAWGVELGVEGTYNSQEISVQSTTVSTDLGINVHLDGLDMSLGEVSYRVTPYAYWSGNGALVVDYAAMPEISAVGGTPTWWQQRYGVRADPCFILPWRYDPEKGFALEDSKKRRQTKDIQFFPKTAVAGDTVRITARVHNFSLMQTPAPITVRFYAADPDSGALPLVNINGADSVLTSAFFAARGMQSVTFDWKVPTSLGAYPRIYAVLDQRNALTEIHENNNIGWNILGKTDAPPVGVAVNRSPSTAMNGLLAGNSLQFRFSLAHASDVMLELFDMAGRRVAVLAKGRYNQGMHLSNAPAIAASGMYLCRMTARDLAGTVLVSTRMVGRLR